MQEVINLMPNKSVRLDNLPKGQIKDKIEQALAEKGMKADIVDFTENKYSWTVKKNFVTTFLILERKPSRPLFVNVITDHVQFPAATSGLVVKQRKQGQQRRPVWIYYLLWFALPVIFSVLATFFSILTTTQLPTFLGIALLISAIIFLVGRYTWAKFQKKELLKLDRQVFDTAVEVLEQLSNETLRSVPTKKCWNCFAEVPTSNEYCEQCGKSQFNIDN
ncbi:MAG: hypothetical protein D6732_11140 [Methanobacteriota archaeon]|nr:MAG: hypothetical protein D6732_11140 [Euryarchaeota archaeon]